MLRRRIIQFVAFTLASVLEVQVRADEILSLPEAKSPIEVPSDCLIESSICTLKTKKHQRYTLEMDQVSVVLSADATFSRLSANSGTVIAGKVFVNAKSKFRIETPYGAITTEGAEFLVYHHSKQILVRTLSGSVTLEPLGHEKSLPLNSGYENWIGRADVTGKATLGIPAALDYNSVMKDFAPIYPGSKKEFAGLLHELRSTWQDSVTESALTHASMVKRELAAQAEQRKQKELAQKRWEDERDLLRSIMIKKNFE